jgi:hypothetical protein
MPFREVPRERFPRRRLGREHRMSMVVDQRNVFEAISHQLSYQLALAIMAHAPLGQGNGLTADG